MQTPAGAKRKRKEGRVLWEEGVAKKEWAWVGESGVSCTSPVSPSRKEATDLMPAHVPPMPAKPMTYIT
jgi:hypothetical protein